MDPLKVRMNSYQYSNQVAELGLYPFFRPIESEQDTVVKINGKDVMMFGSNSYLGLTGHPKVKEAAIAAVKKYGTGCAGSRFLNGTLDIHIQLEDKLAELTGKEGALVYSTGFQANFGTIPALVGRHDYILIDEYVHASIIEGCRLSFAKLHKFKHNDMESLEKELQKMDPDKIKLIIVDGIFSMEGDIAKLDQIVKLKEKYNATVFVDDAHVIGVLGDKGQGTSAHFGVTDKVDVISGTFSKSLASLGGFIAADKETITYLKHHARSLIFSASIPPASSGAAMAAIDIMVSEPERMKKLWDNTLYAQKLLKESGFDIGHSETPIIPIYVRDNMKTFQITKMLMDDGVFVNPVVSPAVKSDSSLIRFSLMATHSFAQIEEACEKIKKHANNLQIFEMESFVKAKQ